MRLEKMFWVTFLQDTRAWVHRIQHAVTRALKKPERAWARIWLDWTASTVQ